MRTLVVLLVLLVSGCSSLRSVEEERAAAVDLTRSIFLKVVDNANMDYSQLKADGKVVNPAYRYWWFGGVGPFSAGEIQAVGVDIGGSVSGGGVGTSPADPDMRDRINEILSRSDVAFDKQRTLITDVLKMWADRAIADEPVEVQPTTRESTEEPSP